MALSPNPYFLLATAHLCRFISLSIFFLVFSLALCSSHIQFSPVAQSCPTLCNSMDCSMPGLPVHRQLPEFIQTHVKKKSGLLVNHRATMLNYSFCHSFLVESAAAHLVLCTVLVTQSSPTLCEPMDYSLPNPSVHGILQARILEWVAILFPGGSFQPRDQTQVSCFADRFFTV